VLQVGEVQILFILENPSAAYLVEFDQRFYMQDIMTEVNASRKSTPTPHDPKKLGADIKNHPCYQQWIGSDMDYAGTPPL
jgi:hypothetical protein